MTPKRSKILYAASTASHLRRFHMPYIERLREDHDVYLMGSRGEGIDFPIDFAKRFFSLSNLRSIGKIRRILKKERFDRVIVNTTLAAFLIRAAMIGMKKRPFVINVVHGYLFADGDKGLKARILLLCEKLLRRQTNVIAVMNRDDLGIVQKNRLCLGDVFFMKGMGIPDVMEIPERDAALRARYATDEGDILCAFVGELSGRKNQIFLIRAIAKLRAQGLPARLLLLGEGSERENLEKEISELGLVDSAFLAGNCEPIAPYLGVADLYVSASVSEGLPFNVMEAMAFGLPIVMSDTKGQNDLKTRTDEAVLYPLDDTDAFCDAVRQVIEKGKLGARAYAYPQLETYRLKSVFDQNMEILLKGEPDEKQA